VKVDKEALLARLASASNSQDASRYRSVGDNRVAASLNVQFAVNSSLITSAFDEEIGRAAAFLQANPDVVAIVEGHTDISGTAVYNQWLSERRANAVRSLLVEKYAVRDTQISAVGHGQSRPIADNTTAEGRALNRRVDLVLDSSGS
jgi:adhesin transport system outer membrane protein